MRQSHIGDGRQFDWGEHPSGGVIGRIENQQLASGGQLRSQSGLRDAEVVFFAQGDVDSHTAGELHTGHVGDPGGIEDQHLIALVYRGHDRGKQRQLSPWGYDDLAVRVKVQTILFS